MLDPAWEGRSAADAGIGEDTSAEERVKGPELPADVEPLRAPFLARPATRAARCTAPVPGEDPVPRPGGDRIAEQDGIIKEFETPGDVNARRARAAIPAPGAAIRTPGTVEGADLVKDREVPRGEGSGPGAFGGGDVLPELVERAHPGEHHGHLGLVPEPGERPLGGGAHRTGPRPEVGGTGDRAGEGTPPERLHHDHPEPPFRGVPDGPAPPGGINVHVIVLHLREGPVVRVDDRTEGVQVVVEREGGVPDSAVRERIVEEVEHAEPAARYPARFRP